MITARASWGASKEGVERFVSTVMALHYGVLASCPGCDGLAPVVPLDDRMKYVAAYECLKCGATFVKRCKYTHVRSDERDNEAAP